SQTGLTAIAPICGAPLGLMLLSDGKGQRRFECVDDDRPAMRLRPVERAAAWERNEWAIELLQQIPEGSERDLPRKLRQQASEWKTMRARPSGRARPRAC